MYLQSYLQRGPPDSPFAGGEYHGVLLFPSEYPFKPPGIKVFTPVTLFASGLILKFLLQMFTPSGRFYPDKKICFSMSDFHPASVSHLSS
jgi:ubiquitin-conjugating enzyme E2 J2